MRFIIQIFGVGKTGLASVRQKSSLGDGVVVENIFVRPVFWSASELNFSSRDATRVPAAGKPQKPADFARVKPPTALFFEQPVQNRTVFLSPHRI
jgi:hypothetical protein